MTVSRSPTPATAGHRTATFLLRQPRLAQGFREPLPAQAGAPASEDPALTMLWIPPGRFWMGPAPGELGIPGEEGPRQLVDVRGFFMAQTPITQAQWRAVATWDPPGGKEWERELNPSPSFFSSDNASKQPPPFFDGAFQLFPQEPSTDQRPVDNVDWNDAREFCRRLSQRTGRAYSLPSEAQWEVACRAGTTKPFAFGPTLSAQLANTDTNSDASDVYGNGAMGSSRQQTTPVGIFPANAWGLHDMHGNVQEWCLDDWPWPQGAGKMVVTRGGSWHDPPIACRSAARARELAGGGGSEMVGFRVVCLPQGRSIPPGVEAPGAEWNATTEWSPGSASVVTS